MRSIFILAIACCPLLTGCMARIMAPTVTGSGSIEREDRPITAFRKIQFSGAGEIYCQRGDSPELAIEADNNILPYLSTEVVNETLIISFKSNINLKPSKPIKFLVTATKLCDELEILGSGNAVIDDLEGDSFALKIAGSSKTTLQDVDVKNLTISIQGSGEIDATGSVDTMKCNVAGSGKIHTFDLNARNVELNISGSGKGEVNASDDLSVTISGSGDVRHRGTPTAISKKISGSGSIKPE